MDKSIDRHRRKLLEQESGTPLKKRRAAGTRVVAVYPNTYHVAMSNLGFQSVFRLLNSMDDIVCERSFLPETRFKNANDIISIESGSPLRQFDVVAFSISFENDYPNVLSMLHTAGLPLTSRQRSDAHPLIVAGGVACLLNPEPLAPFIDCFFIGEAEAMLEPFFENYRAEGDRRARLKSAAQRVRGIYAPRFYRPRYHADGRFESLEPENDVPSRIQRAYLPDLDDADTCSAILTPNTTFDGTHLIEVSRGCPHGCRFCGAGFVYRPPRYRSRSFLTNSIERGARRCDKIGLVGAAVSDLPGLDDLCRDTPAGTTLSFSSLRADGLSDERITLLKKSGVKTATIAPDAGSERLRRVINKGLEEPDILDAAEMLVSRGIPNLKLYFMVGLPGETTEDVDAVVQLCKKIKHRFLKTSREKKRIGDITVSLNSFVPKPHTPFQWAPMDGVQTLKDKIKRVKQGLKKTPNVQVHADVPKWAFIQALLSRGDRRVADILHLLHGNQGNWAKTLKDSPHNPDFYVSRERDLDEAFPWDFIDHGVSKSFLIAEYQKAMQGKTTPPCDPSSCKMCGACRSTGRPSP